MALKYQMKVDVQQENCTWTFYRQPKQFSWIIISSTLEISLDLNWGGYTDGTLSVIPLSSIYDVREEGMQLI